jgi:hypothetical protein
MNKPDWKDAPEWAQWLAQDYDGQWGWFSVEPRQSPYASTWFWETGEWEEAAQQASNIGWETTLEPRP